MLYTTFYTHCGHTREAPEQAQARSHAEALAAPKSLWGRIKQSIKPGKERPKLEFVQWWCPDCMSIRYNTGYEPFQRSPRRSAAVSGPSGTQDLSQERERDDAGHRRAPDPRATAETLSLLENPEDLAALASLVAAQHEARASRESRGSLSWHVNTPENRVEQLTELQLLRLDLLHESDHAFRVLHRRLRHPAFVTYGPKSCRDCDAVRQACLADYVEKQRIAHNNGRHDFTARVTYDIELDAFLSADYWVELAFARPETPPIPGEPDGLDEDVFVVGDEFDIFEEVHNDEDVFVVGDEFDIVEEVHDDLEHFINLSDDEEDVSPMTTPTPNPRLGRDLLRHRPKMIFNHETCESTNDWGLPRPEVRYDEDPLEALYTVHFPPLEQSNGESSSKGKEHEVPIWSVRVPDPQEALASAVSRPLQEADEPQGSGLAEAVDAGRLGRAPYLPTLIWEAGPSRSEQQPLSTWPSDAGRLTGVPDLAARVLEPRETIVDPSKLFEVSDVPARPLKIDDTEVSTQPESTVASRAASLAAIKSKWAAMMEKHAKWDEKILDMVARAIKRCPGEPDPAKWAPWIEVGRRIDAALLECEAIKARALAEVNSVEDQQADTLADRLEDESATKVAEQSTDECAETSSILGENEDPKRVAEQDQEPDSEIYGLVIELVPMLNKASADELADPSSTSEEDQTYEEVAEQEQDPDAQIEGLEYEFAPTLAEESTDQLAGTTYNLEENEPSEEAGQTGTNFKNEDGVSALTSDNDTPTEEPDDNSGSDYKGTAIVEEDSDGESEGAGFDGFESPADFFGRFEDNERFEDEERSSQVPHVRNETLERESTVYLPPESVELPPSPSPPQTPAESPTSPSSPRYRINPYTPAGQAAAQLVRSYYGVPSEVPLYETSFFTGRPSFSAHYDKPKLKWKTPRRGKIHGRLISQGPLGEYGLNVSWDSWNYRCEVFDLGAMISWAADPFASVFEDSDVSENGDVSDNDDSDDNAEPKQEADEEYQQQADTDNAVSSSSSSSPPSSSSSSSDSPFPLSHLSLNANFHRQLQAVDGLFSEQGKSGRAAFEAAFDELYDPDQPNTPSLDDEFSSISSLSPISPPSDEEPVYDGLIVRTAPLPTEAQEKLAYQPKERSSLRKELLDDGSF